jgi:plasmid stability protein
MGETENNSLDILIKNVPDDIVQELGRRAEAHFRSRSGEILAILAAVCRGEATLPGLALGEQDGGAV